MTCYNCLKEIENNAICPYCKESQIYKTLEFNVNGITFENEQGKDIQKEIRKALLEYERNGCIEKYGGYTNTDIKELEIEVAEFEDVKLEMKIKEDTYQGKPAIKIYIKKYDESYCHIGYMPKKIISKYLKLKDSFKKVEMHISLVGGKIKQLKYDYFEEKDKVETTELTYGFEVKLIFYNDENKFKKQIEQNKQKAIEEWNKLKKEQELKIQEEKERKNKEFAKINTKNNIIIFFIVAIVSIPFIWLIWKILSFVFWIINF